MVKLIEINAIGYCDNRDYNSVGKFIVKKNRVFDIYGSYKVTKAYQLEVDTADVNEMFKHYNFNPKYNTLTITQAINYYQSVKKLIPDKRVVSYGENWMCGYNALVDPKTFYTNSTFKTPIFFLPKDFVKLQPTKKELEILATLDNRHKMQKLNSLVLKDNILQLLEKYKVESKIHCTSDAICFSNKTGFNKLVKDAIEYYLNDIVLKDLGCKIVVPKQIPSHCYNYYDPVCYVGDIEMIINKGE